jgi:cytochrome c biogenesis protein CcmG, thiol:disulfide interchange protein DsbE
MAGRVKHILQAAAVSVVALLLVLLGWQVFKTEGARSLADKVKAGEKPEAPDFELELLNGSDRLRLSSFEGEKAVVINFWASWCLPCRDEAPLLEAAWKRWRDDGVVFVGIDAQDFRADGRGFVERYGVTYPNVYDGSGSTLGRFGVTGRPETWFVDRDGRLVGERFQGPITEEMLERNIRLALRST